MLTIAALFYIDLCKLLTAAYSCLYLLLTASYSYILQLYAHNSDIWAVSLQRGEPCNASITTSSTRYIYKKLTCPTQISSAEGRLTLGGVVIVPSQQTLPLQSSFLRSAGPTEASFLTCSNPLGLLSSASVSCGCSYLGPSEVGEP